MTTATKANGTSLVTIPAPTELVSVPKPDIREANFRIVGTAPLICHRWSEKAKKEMLDKQMKRAKSAKEAKDPEQDFLDSLYPMPGVTLAKGQPVPADSCGFPTIAFKAAAVRAGSYADLKMVYLRGCFHVTGELVRILGTPEPREDMVRVGMGTADIRYRGQFEEWAVDLPIRFNSRAISLEQIANLLVIAGFSVGVGEWRPERDGQYGTWDLA